MNTIWLFLFFVSMLSCQSGLKPTSTTSAGSNGAFQTEGQSGLPDKYEHIKKEKKSQSLLDLPFRGFDANKTLMTIAAGSCADQNQPQPIWKTIEKNSPDLFIFSGDTVYSSRPDDKPVTAQFKKLNFIYEYRDARLKFPFMAIWDDHDYGQNDGGFDNPEKEYYRAEFVKYWRYLSFAIPAKQKALYHAKIFGSKKNKVQIIMLDTRWDRSALKKNTDDSFKPDNPEPGSFPRPYMVTDDPKARILSEEQWAWLETELRKPAEVRIIVSSIQIIADDHNFEKWGNFPKERERFFSLLKKTKAKNSVLLSGDRHMATLAKSDAAGFPVVELTASAINRPATGRALIPDKTYLGEPYPQANFGLIKIDWDKKKVLLEVRSQEDEVKNFAEVKF